MTIRIRPTINPHNLSRAMQSAWMNADDRNTVGDHHAWLRRAKLVIEEYALLMEAQAATQEEET